MLLAAMALLSRPGSSPSTCDMYAAEGDAFLMAFHEPAAAVAWALATQQVGLQPLGAQRSSFAMLGQLPPLSPDHQLCFKQHKLRLSDGAVHRLGNLRQAAAGGMAAALARRAHCSSQLRSIDTQSLRSP